MNFKWALQTAFLSTSLVATLLAIFFLKSDHTPDVLASLGFSNSKKINWCEKRISQISFKGKSTITELQGKWGIQTQDEHILIDYIEFEKWLAQFCLLKGEQADTKNILQEPLLSVFDIRYIDGETVTLYKIGGDKFQIKQLLFRSSHLEKLMEQYVQFFPKSLRPSAQ